MKLKKIFLILLILFPLIITPQVFAQGPVKIVHRNDRLAYASKYVDDECYMIKVVEINMRLGDGSQTKMYILWLRIWDVSGGYLVYPPKWEKIVEIRPNEFQWNLNYVKIETSIEGDPLVVVWTAESPNKIFEWEWDEVVGEYHMYSKNMDVYREASCQLIYNSWPTEFDGSLWVYVGQVKYVPVS
jgi:hypothetical protein